MGNILDKLNPIAFDDSDYYEEAMAEIQKEKDVEVNDLKKNINYFLGTLLLTVSEETKFAIENFISVHNINE